MDPLELPRVAEGQPPAVVVVPDSHAEPPLRLEWAFRAVNTLTLAVEGASRRILPDAWNPLLRAGAAANTLLLVAVGTGVLLLFWYSPSVHLAHASMREIEASPLAATIRAAHRYSSDGCLFFVVWHSLRLVAARRFTGPRWLAWVTGVLGVGLLWLVGWLGYWLVWDEVARQVTLGTARVLDVLPIFADPLSRQFLTDKSVNSLLFFVVFFVHMLLPMGLGVALWLHIARLARSEFLLSLRASGVVTLITVALSLVLPPTAAAAAHMAKLPGRLAIDGWYVLPLIVTDRFSGGALLAAGLGVGALIFAVPWLLAKRKLKPAEIVVSRCNACEQCMTDCPYEAISMVPRTDGRPFKTQALVDPTRCLGCGVCAGSCSSGGSRLPHFDTLLERARIERWLEEGPSWLAFVCHDVAGSLDVDDATGKCGALPEYRVVKVPCAGWVQAITIDRALKRGAPGVLIAGCAGSCRYREGVEWTSQRLAGTRSVELPSGADKARVRLVTFDGPQPARLSSEASAFRAGAAPGERRVFPKWVGVGAMGLLVTALVYGVSVLPYAPPRSSAARLVVTFKHPGAVEEHCHTLTAEELAKLPVHMRREKVCDRGRQPVRLEVSLDGQVVLAKSYAPHGLWGDGASVGLEELDAPEGSHLVRVRIGDAADQTAWAFVEERTLELRAGERPAVLFDRASGFTWPDTPN